MKDKANLVSKIDEAESRLSVDVIRRQLGLDTKQRPAMLKTTGVQPLLEKREVKFPPHPAVMLPEPIDWHADPLNQRNWCAQLHMMRWIRPLIASSQQQNDQKAQKELEAIIWSWADSAYPRKGSPKYAWSDMIDAVRVFELMAAYEAVGFETQELLERLLYDHGRWLMDPKNLGHSNHALWQHKALFVLGAAFDQCSWKEAGKSRIIQSLESEYDVQGVNREGALGYHLYNYKMWSDVELRLNAEAESIDVLSETLSKARGALVQGVRPDGYLEELGDTDPLKDLQSIAGSADVEYVLSRGASGDVPSSTCAIFERGYVFGRSGWGENERDFEDEFFYSLKFGEIAPHGHNDLGSLTTYSNGEKVLIDAGKYGYIKDSIQEYCFSRRGHNTVIVEGQEEDLNASYLLEHSYHNATVDDLKIHGTPYKGVKHQRQVIYVRGADALFVIDTVRSKSQHDYKCLWHFHPDAQVNQEKGRINISIGGKGYSLSTFGTTPTVEVIKGWGSGSLDGWYSPSWGENIPAPTIAQAKKGESLRFMSVIATDQDSKKTLVEKLPGAKTGVLIKTKAGFFTVNADSSPATVEFSRTKPAFLDKETSTNSDFADLVNSICARLEKEELVDDESTLGNLLFDRLKLTLPSEADSSRKPSELVREVFRSPYLDAALDHGLRAALIDYLGFMLGTEDDLVKRLLQSRLAFRAPITSSDDVSLTDSSQFVTCAGPNREDGARISGRYAIPWSGQKGNKTLIVRFNGAIDRAKITLPYFGGSSLLFARPESSLVFSDPALEMNADLRLGWYLGETGDGQLLFDEINFIIDEYVEKWGIEKVVLFGSSGGGFASLQIGLRRENASILAINPQTVLPNYFPVHYRNGIRSAFGVELPNDFPYLDAVDVRGLLSQASLSNLIYVDNKDGDVHHHKLHFLPFKEAAEKAQIRFQHQIIDLGKGHRGISVDETNFYLDQLVRYEK